MNVLTNLTVYIETTLDVYNKKYSLSRERLGSHNEGKNKFKMSYLLIMNDKLYHVHICLYIEFKWYGWMDKTSSQGGKNYHLI